MSESIPPKDNGDVPRPSPDSFFHSNWRDEQSTVDKDPVSKVISESEKDMATKFEDKDKSLKLKKSRNKTRVYRRSGSQELKDPTQSPTAEVNRLSTVFKARIDPELAAMANKRINSDGITKREWLENAIRRALESDS